MWKDGFVVEQITLCIQAHHLTSCAEAWVDTHDTFLAEWGREQQLAQVLLEHMDGLLVGPFLAQCSKLILYRWLQEPFIAVLCSLFDESSARIAEAHILALQSADSLLIVRRNAHSKKSLALAATHCQQTMRGTPLQWLREIKVVAVFLCFVCVLLRLDSLRGDNSLASECTAQLVARLFVLVDIFSDDVLGAL